MLLQTVTCISFVAFGVTASSSLGGLSAYINLNDSLKSLSLLFQGLIHTICSRTLTPLSQPSLLSKQYYVWTILRVCWTDERGTFKDLDILPKDQSDLWRSTSLSLISFPNLFWRFPAVTQESRISEVCHNLSQMVRTKQTEVFKSMKLSSRHPQIV